MFSRVTDDYERMAMAGIVAVLEPAFWLGQPRTSVGSFVDYFDTILGWERWRAMEEHHALGGIRAVLQAIADEGKVRPELVGTLANVLLASVNEVALIVARAQDQEAAMKSGADTIDELLRRLFG